jgi:hypothetical protein
VSPVVIGLPARDEADEVVALALCHLLRLRGISAAVNPLAAPLVDVFNAIDHGGIKAVFISALPPSAVGAARQMCRRVTSHSLRAPVLVGVWQHHASFEEVEKRLEPGHPGKVVLTLEDAVEQLAVLLHPPARALDDGTQPLRLPPEKISPK